MQAFSCLATLPASTLVIACPATNPWSLSPTRGDTPVKSTHACFPPSHPKTRIQEVHRSFLFCRDPCSLKDIIQHISN
uniref:Secreted protein n=1 Tax=Helianthus annuus TaxID=4232 RepID=A0A251VG62_HELAN